MKYSSKIGLDNFPVLCQCSNNMCPKYLKILDLQRYHSDTLSVPMQILSSSWTIKRIVIMIREKSFFQQNQQFLGFYLGDIYLHLFITVLLKLHTKCHLTMYLDFQVLKVNCSRPQPGLNHVWNNQKATYHSLRNTDLFLFISEIMCSSF